MRQRLFALLIVFLFLGSLMPLSLAEQSSGQDVQPAVQVGRLTAEKANPDARLRGARPKEKAVTALKRLKTRYPKRVIAREKLVKARENLAKARLRAVKSKENVEKARTRLRKLVGENKIRKACKDDPESDGCKQAKEEVFDAVKDDTLKELEFILNMLNRIKDRIDSNERISQDLAEKIVPKLEQYISDFEGIKNKVESASDKEELLAARKELREKWSDFKLHLKLYLGLDFSHRIGWLVEKSKSLELRMDKVLELMVKGGKDTSEIEPLVKEFKDDIAQADSYHSSAIEDYKSALDLDNKDDITDKLKSARENLRKAHKSLTDANKVLKKVGRLLRSKARKELRSVPVAKIREEISSDNADAGEGNGSQADSDVDANETDNAVEA